MTKMARVKYLGAKVPRTFALPMPFLSLSSKIREIRFETAGQTVEVEAEQATVMCEAFPELFELVTEKTEKKPGKSTEADSPKSV